MSRDRRYDSFKTWSGKLERQLAHLAGAGPEFPEEEEDVIGGAGASVGQNVAVSAPVPGVGVRYLPRREHPSDPVEDGGDVSADQIPSRHYQGEPGASAFPSRSCASSQPSTLARWSSSSRPSLSGKGVGRQAGEEVGALTARSGAMWSRWQGSRRAAQTRGSGEPRRQGVGGGGAAARGRRRSTSPACTPWRWRRRRRRRWRTLSGRSPCENY
uniref:Uncharacterized protein n=1 Tax=Oryza nivara TaxID=4536 RepID=A0A0E0G7P6_ORYNI